MNLALGGSSGLAGTGFNGMAVLDGFAVYANILILGSGLLGIALAYDYLRRMGLDRGEYYVLLLISTAGMMLMVQAYDLIVVFLALELLSIPLYVLSGFARPQAISQKNQHLKYFLLGAFASAFLPVWSRADLRRLPAHTDLTGIVAAVQQGSSNSALLMIGAALLLVGLGFKVSAVPFHMWTPDVYQGAPTPVTAFMAVSVKVAGFAALLRVFIIAFPTLAAGIQPVLWGLAALTMIVGNLLAIVQTNIKRLLAYSSIAHVGYLLMAFVPYGNGEVVANAVAATLFYLVGYGLTSFAAWGVVVAVEQKEGRGLAAGGLCWPGTEVPLAGRGHDGGHVLLYRHPNDAGILGQILCLPGRGTRRRRRTGLDWPADLAVFRVLLPASAGGHVHAPRRTHSPAGQLGFCGYARLGSGRGRAGVYPRHPLNLAAQAVIHTP